MNLIKNCNASQKAAILASFIALCKLEPNNINAKELDFVKNISSKINFEIDPVLIKLVDKSGEKDRVLILNTLVQEQKEQLIRLLFVMIKFDPSHGDPQAKENFIEKLGEKMGISEDSIQTQSLESISDYMTMLLLS
jgi:hypothetical protein